MERSPTILDEVLSSFGADLGGDPALHLSADLPRGCAGTTPNTSPNPQKKKNLGGAKLCKARNGFARPILKLANLTETLRVIAVARVNFWGRCCVVPRYSWGGFGGWREARFWRRILRAL